jgi:2-polyprenyl-3-methyl-5-hydroxy-6-metoxy-1,4-benzoquinol methylase
MKRNESTIKNWDKLALSYQSKFMEMDLYNATYDQFCDSINNETASILELGCGPGNITKYIQDKNPNYTILATDTAPSMIELGKKNVPNATFQVLDVREIMNLNKHFDAILCGFVLPYLNQEESKQFISDSFKLLNTNGILYFSCIEKEKSYSETQTSSDGKFTMEVNYHDANYLLQTLADNNFETLSVSRINYQKPDNKIDIHLIIIAKKG